MTTTVYTVEQLGLTDRQLLNARIVLGRTIADMEANGLTADELWQIANSLEQDMIEAEDRSSRALEIDGDHESIHEEARQATEAYEGFKRFH